MKRLLIVAALALSPLALIPHQAGAATVSPNPVIKNAAWTPGVPGTDVKAVTNKAERQYAKGVADGTVEEFYGSYLPAGSVDPHASITCCGWGTATLHMTHQDLASPIGFWIFVGVAAGSAKICDFLPWYVAAPCILATVAAWAWLSRAMIGAWSNWTAQAIIPCVGVPQNGACWYSGAYWNPFDGWVQNVQDTGLDVVFTWTGVPVGWTYN